MKRLLLAGLLFVAVGFGQTVQPGGGSGGGGGAGTVTSVTVAGTTNQINVTGTCTGTDTISCTLSLPSGLILPGTVDGLTITTTTGTLTITGAKVLTVNKSLTLDGTDGVTLTFPATSATIARTDAGQTFTGAQAFSSSPTMPTVSQADNSTKGATTAYVDTGLATKGAGTVTSIATTSPITGGTITATGTIACATCVTSAASLTSLGAMVGAGSQGSQTSSQLTVANLGTPGTEVWTMTNTSLGTTPAGGLTLNNSTAAAVGAQQISPPITMCGNGWKTTATAASQQTCWRITNLPVQGTANPTGQLTFSANVNGGSYSSYMTFTADGINPLAVSFPGSTTVATLTANSLSIQGWTAFLGTGATVGGAALGQGHGVYWAAGNTNSAASGDTSLCREGAKLIQFSSGTCGTTTAANYGDAKLRHAIAGGTPPTITSGFGSSPSIAGVDESFVITIGTGGTGNTGVIAFGTAYTTNSPNFSCNSDDGTPTYTSSYSASGFTISGGTASVPVAWTAAAKVHCTGRGYL